MILLFFIVSALFFLLFRGLGLISQLVDLDHSHKCFGIGLLDIIHQKSVLVLVIINVYCACLYSLFSWWLLKIVGEVILVQDNVACF